MNKAILIGRLTKEPELKFTTSGIAVTYFNLAVNRNYADQSGQRQTDYINIVCWRKLAENVANNLSKGRLVAVSGAIQTRKYQAQDGSNRYVTEIVADEVKFLDWQKDRAAQVASSVNEAVENGFISVNSDDDIPF